MSSGEKRCVLYCMSGIQIVLQIFLQMHGCSGFLAITTPIRIDCGSTAPTLDTLQNATFQADTWYSGGSPKSINNTLGLSLTNQSQLTTLRAFPAGTTPCYALPLATGRYMVRISILYLNYDGLQAGPSFFVLLAGVRVDFVNTAVQERRNTNQAYVTDYLVYSDGSPLQLCVEAVEGVPILNAIEIFPSDTDSYATADLDSTGVVLRAMVRVNSGGAAILGYPDDFGYRLWNADFAYNEANYTNASRPIAGVGADAAPDYLPDALFRTCRVSTADSDGLSGYSLVIADVSIGNSSTWLLRLYFAELHTSVAPGGRLMDVFRHTANEGIVYMQEGLDVVRQSGFYNATSVTSVFDVDSITGGVVSFSFGVLTANESVVKSSLCGAEVFQVFSTQGVNQTQVVQDLTNVKSTGNSGGSQGLSTALIVVIVLGSILGLALLVSACYFAFLCFKKQRVGDGDEPNYVARVSSISSVLTGSLSGSRRSSNPERAAMHTSYERSSEGLFTSSRDF